MRCEAADVGRLIRPSGFAGYLGALLDARQRPPSARSDQTPKGIVVGVRSGGHAHPSPLATLAGKSLPGRLARLALRTGPEVHRPVKVANCSITTLRVFDCARRLVRANEVGRLELRGPQGY